MILNDLIAVSHELGREDRALAILGEGNSSALNDDGTFWIKASGAQLNGITEEGFARARLDSILSLLSAPDLGDAAVADGLLRSLVTPTQTPSVSRSASQRSGVGETLDVSATRPSVETFLHAVCYAESGARWIGHTHPVSVNSILCSQLGAQPFRQHIFPDEIVNCGRDVAVVPYVDPGFPLARAVRDELRRFQDTHGHSPKTLLMINHGLVALGQTARDVLSITLMMDKWAKILLGAYSLGGAHFLSGAEADRIDSRSDEHYRRAQWAKD
ncbi:MAG: class II aldolase/adducin family protein [Chloroflexi bacterium]|nr:class II aldolase/adducin family protein [Chloroflexota bacterium]